jgi:hypothetical protein
MMTLPSSGKSRRPGPHAAVEPDDCPASEFGENGAKED